MTLFFDILQLVSGIILAFGYVPQIIQIVRTKSVKDLNLRAFLLISAGIFLSELYAINLTFVQKAGGMFLVTNTMALLMPSAVCLLIIKYRKVEKVS